ncbi:AEC family transporter [Lacibacterium aquatile]|uniref:AEC family transporter n=1 Tax=Lacibacterium aquatile TaxID=1168082 RepID=A0ABW5DWV1_9PROT
MIAILAALIPIFLLILAGYGLKRLRFLPEQGWQSLDRLNYFVLFPVLLLTSVGKAEIGRVELLPLLCGMLGGVASVAVLTLACRKLIGGSGPTFTSAMQGAIRFNTYVTLAGAAGLWGPAGTATIALGIAFAVPLVNIFCIATLLKWGEGGGHFGPKTFVLQLVRNPLIVGCVAGLIVNLAGGFPTLIKPFFDILAAASLPLGLLSVGASLDWESARRAGRPVLISSALKLLAFPCIAHGIARLMGADPLTLGIVTLFGSMPTATAAVVLARQMGGDVKAMAAITTFQTLAAFVTVPLMLGLLLSL